MTLRYKRRHIGLEDGGRPNNFVVFMPKRRFALVEPRLADRARWAEELRQAGLFVLPGGKKRLHFRLDGREVERHAALLRRMFEEAYRQQGE